MITTLIVEDNIVFRKAFKEALQFYFPFLQIEEASEGLQALKIVREQHPRLIFMDIRLPGESGLTLTKKIRSLSPASKVVILTSYDAPEYLEAAAEAGAACFAVKGDLGPECLQALMHEMNVLMQ